MTSGITVGTHPKRTDGYQALAFQPNIRHPGLCRQDLRQLPVALAADRRENCLTLTRAQRQKIADLGAHPAPLFPAKQGALCARGTGVMLDERHVIVAHRFAVRSISLPSTPIAGRHS